MRYGRSILAALAFLFLIGGAAGQVNLDPPGELEFILDRANLLNEHDETAVRVLCANLLKAKATTIIVVTIDRMSDHRSGGRVPNIESFASMLFDQWRVGHAEINGADWNTGIVLLVSKGDRKARIELGAGWGRAQDDLCDTIMQERIIPAFKEGDYSLGILRGVEALEQMARGKRLPRIPLSWGYIFAIVAFIAIAVFTAVSLKRRGASGWAWLAWAAVFSIGGMLLMRAISNRGSSFGGGSFGGGFSGGGGATGSW